MGLFGKKDDEKGVLKPKDIFKEAKRAGGSAAAIETVKYLGGHPNLSKNNIDGIFTINKNGIFFDQTLTNNFFHIESNQIISGEFKTEEQISKDVTFTRLLALGVFAFAFKKKTKEVTNYLVVKFYDEGIENTVVFEVKNAGSLASSIMKIKQEYARENPQIAATIDQTVDIADQIKKLSDLKDTGILTEEEFQQKKEVLLSKIV
ncbi:hypothetical protein HNQ80_004308 [Anaerosolibacter carboniphilus]|uniref:SHOCT domain-containing protein n=1 Tax=Anaerosolibacter carboniphilus TaxID=1417629 RepID=A0A841L0Q6_9FIRM|nr:SHOCT domain-containing protein [Anaerosolibacter carboniphilus]MBB6218168.1 hypothetical protein [Anaerosolibacter carboniphilus]